MEAFKSYPNSVNTPSRKTRKGLRNSVFIFNKKLAKRLKKEARKASNVESA